MGPDKHMKILLDIIADMNARGLENAEIAAIFTMGLCSTFALGGGSKEAMLSGVEIIWESFESIKPKTDAIRTVLDGMAELDEYLRKHEKS